MTKPHREWTGRLTPGGSGVIIDCEEVRSGGMSFPSLERLDDFEWQLRYGDPECVAMAAASVVSAYGALIRKNRRERDAIVRCIRQASKDKPVRETQND